MSTAKRPPLIVITGPTASGKSALAVALAGRLQTEIISADSRQIYRGIPIVTAVPSVEERAGIPHHLIEMFPLEAYYSAANFETDAITLFRDISSRTGSAIVCGGSMLYVDALCNGIDTLPTVPVELRHQLENDWQLNGDGWLLNELQRLDPAYFERVDRKNLKRVFHAVEISLTAGVPYSTLLTGRREVRDFPIIKICLDGDRQLLFERINRRVEMMVEQGLEEEARSVQHKRHLNSLNTVGLKEMFAYFDGRMTREEAIARIQKNTRVYAKKQMTWHKRGSDMIRLDFADGTERNCNLIINLLREYNPE